MAFRSSEYVQLYEMVQYRLDDVIRMPANGHHKQKNGYKFTVNDRSSSYHWYNAYFEVQFRVQHLGDGAAYPAADDAANRCTLINGTHSLIKHMTIKSAGKIAYDTDNLHQVVFTKNLMEYSDDFSRSEAKESFWYLDTVAGTELDEDNEAYNAGFAARRTLTAANADVNVIIL